MLRTALLLLLLPIAAIVQAADPGFEIVAYGTYGDFVADERMQTPGSSSGDVGVIAGETHLEPVVATDRIAAAPGVRFGFQFVARNLRTFDDVPVEIRVTHPPMMLPDGRVSTIDHWPMHAQGIPRFTGWLFEHDYELVPGEWTIAVVHDGAVAVEKTFHVSLEANRAPAAR
jgi:hypothetical protein